MGLFSKKKSINNEGVQKISIDDLASSIVQLGINEMSDINDLLEKNGVKFDFYLMASCTLAYYSSIWLSFVKKESSDNIYNSLKNKLENGIENTIVGACKNENLDCAIYVNKFHEEFEKAIEISNSSIIKDGFQDSGISDKYLLSFLDYSDIMMAKKDIVIRIMTNWARPVIQVISNISIFE